MRKARPLVLVVDCVPDTGRALCCRLSNIVNCEAVAVTNAWDAVALILTAQPSVVLIETAPIDGVEVALSVRARMDGQAPFLIAMTDEHDIMRPAQANVFDYVLVTPVDMKQLVALLLALPTGTHGG